MSDIQMTKLANCAGCGAKVGAGMLAQLLEGLPVRRDERLLVGYDRSDDASVYLIDEHTALVQTVDFFPPIADDPFTFGQIAACNALSDVYAMGGEPRLALNIMTVSREMDRETIHSVLRGGYEKAYEAGVIITGGHTIEDSEPKYGLAVTGFADPKRILKNCTARPGDVLILTKPLGVGILCTAAKGDLVPETLMKRLHEQMKTLNRAARDSMLRFETHSCTDVTGFSLMGHAYEMASGSGCTIHLLADSVPYHREAWELADMGFVPAGAYRNRDYVEPDLCWAREIPLPLQDILFDPQTSGGLLIAVAEKDGESLLRALQAETAGAALVGYVTEKGPKALIVE